jgi:Domain of unknown function (DUF4398)
MYASSAIQTPIAKLKFNTASLIIPVIVFIGGLGGCASTPVSVEKMAVAESAVQRANTSSTSESAAAELQIAVAKLASARQAVNNKDYDRARQLAEQAEVDAQVAELHAQSTRSRKAAQESQDAARVLREEINRKTTR